MCRSNLLELRPKDAGNVSEYGSPRYLICTYFGAWVPELYICYRSNDLPSVFWPKTAGIFCWTMPRTEITQRKRTVRALKAAMLALLRRSSREVNRSWFDSHLDSRFALATNGIVLTVLRRLIVLGRMSGVLLGEMAPNTVMNWSIVGSYPKPKFSIVISWQVYPGQFASKRESSPIEVSNSGQLIEHWLNSKNLAWTGE